MAEIEQTIPVEVPPGRVSAILSRPSDAWALYVFAHGAGADMHHGFMRGAAARLHDRGVATLRFQFPYMELGRKAPSPAKVLIATVRAAVATAEALVDPLPLFAGGKSMGGRMTSMAASTAALGSVRGLAFFGFPLHAPGRDSADRGTHLKAVDLPMLFLQGTRDKLANLELLGPLLEEVGRRAELHVSEGADHGFHVLKRSGRSDDEVLDELCDRFVEWAREVLELEGSA